MNNYRENILNENEKNHIWHHFPHFTQINVLLLLLSASVFVISESSLMPVLVLLTYYTVGCLILIPISFGGIWERKIFSRVFLSGTLASAISSLYRNFYGDKQGDAFHFYHDSFLESVGHLSSETAIPMHMFKAVFDFASWLEISPQQYIGVLLNVLLVALSAVFALKTARLIFGNDEYRFKRLILLSSTCGMFWLYAGIMIRDSFALLAACLLTHVWVYFLEKPGINFRLFFLILCSWLARQILIFVRMELVYVPIAMALAGGVSLFIKSRKKKIPIRVYIGSFLLLMIASLLLMKFFGSDILFTILRNQASYKQVSINEGVAGSLGWLLVVNQPLQIKLIAGSIYLFIFPVPFWSGFQLESAYHLFKTLNVVYLYFVTPLVLLSLMEIWSKKLFKKPSVSFLLFLILGFTVAVSVTSLENRHHGNFYFALILLTIIPDLRDRKMFSKYCLALFVYLSGILLMHLLWGILKFL